VHEAVPIRVGLRDRTGPVAASGVDHPAGPITALVEPAPQRLDLVRCRQVRRLYSHSVGSQLGGPAVAGHRDHLVTPGDQSADDRSA
jgi:hypothetical protein